MSIRPPTYRMARPYSARGPTFISRPPPPGGVGAGLGKGAGGGGIAGLIGGLACPLLCLGCLSTLAILGLFATMIGAAAYMNGIQSQLRKSIQGSDHIPPLSENMYRPRAPLPPPGRAGGAGMLGGLLGGLGGAVTCLCCLTALGLIGLWVTFIPFVAFFKYAYDQEVRAFGGSPSIHNLQQFVILLAICLLTMRFVKRQMNT
ncbi:unnamed protein product [Rotaria socialis]|uniref:Uncharacterized protein n=3 Tax=Rotaria socialis TaxID=392032 RepID=A0A820BPE3_9BILA|nr:unnamed protein product [Rotaria socialis]CAF4201849.1 unnamed protein product [Rotaria socialis]CAF4232908.1 unnamed protein product [Rotaria socialis]CAF4570938.1 unnamed protein product [Rotaria socialis]